MESNNSRVKSVKFTKQDALNLVCCIANMVADYARLLTDKAKYLGEVKAAYQRAGSNRNLNDRHVKQYTKDMNEGKWNQQVVDSCVLISPSQCLSGGQHRMWAFLHSDLETITFPTVLDATADDREFQDTGYNRSMNDHVVMAIPTAIKERLMDTRPLMLNRVHSATRILANHHVQHVHQPRKDELALLTEKHIGAFEEIAGHLDADLSFDGSRDMYRYAPALAAFVVAREELDRSLWDRLVPFLQGYRHIEGNLAVDQALDDLSKTWNANKGPSVRANTLFAIFSEMLGALRSLRGVQIACADAA